MKTHAYNRQKLTCGVPHDQLFARTLPAIAGEITIGGGFTMRLINKEGVVSELLSWDFGSPDQSYALVKLPDNSLCEWKVQDCHVVEERKTSEQGESPATDRQQLKAAIALLRRWVDSGSDNIIISDTYHFLNNDVTAAV